MTSGSSTYLLTDLLQRGHPRSSQMAVLQHDPGAFLDALLNHLQGNWALALTQGQRVKLGTTKALYKRRTKCKLHHKIEL